MQWIHQRGIDDFELMTDISKSLRSKLKAIAHVQFPSVLQQQVSVDGTRKWLMQMETGNAVETVYIPDDDRGTLCVSSQIGCSLDCSFCATGKQGFNRDLSARKSLVKFGLLLRLLVN